MNLLVEKLIRTVILQGVDLQRYTVMEEVASLKSPMDWEGQSKTETIVTIILLKS